MEGLNLGWTDGVAVLMACGTRDTVEAVPSTGAVGGTAAPQGAVFTYSFGTDAIACGEANECPDQAPQPILILLKAGGCARHF